MKIIYALVLPAILLLQGSCSKSTDEVAPDVKGKRLTIGNIDNVFTNSAWQHVLGGVGIIQFKPLANTYSTGGAAIKDSLDLKDAANYSRSLPDGKYDITLATRDTENVADTFIRFSATIQNFLLNKESTLTFAGVTTDGLITINKNFVKDNNVPAFTASSRPNAKTNFALINGYYYLYVKGGVEGKVSFVEKTTGQTFAKNIAVSVANQYNLVVISNSVKFLNVVFADFAYEEVPINVDDCPCKSDLSMLLTTWYNAFTEFKYYDLAGKYTHSSTIYPNGYFKLNPDHTYNVLSNGVPQNGDWKFTGEGCRLVLDSDTFHERTFDIVNVSADSLTIYRRDATTSYTQHYSKN